jgi:hypothetical protein
VSFCRAAPITTHCRGNIYKESSENGERARAGKGREEKRREEKSLFYLS